MAGDHPLLRGEPGQQGVGLLLGLLGIHDTVVGNERLFSRGDPPDGVEQGECRHLFEDVTRRPHGGSRSDGCPVGE